jgi:hypothetical protein
MGLTAYHGTPHTIKGKFDISKVGTGEGAQAYGHGMYFAENPAVANQYIKAGDEGFKANAAEYAIKEYGNVDNAIQQLSKKLLDKNEPSWKKDNINVVLEGLNKVKLGQPTGNLYKVDIPDEYIPNMLDWDKPLNMQSSEILKALKIPQEAVDKYNQLTNRLDELQWIKGGIDSPEWVKIGDEAKALRAKYGLHRSGEEVYRESAQLAKELGNTDFSKIAAENLAKQGIKGIRYLDEGSRGKAKNQTSNFVVFDPSEVKILEQNSKPMTRKEIIEQELEKVSK